MDARLETDGPRPGVAAGPDFAALFLSLPSPYMVLDRGLRYVAVNDAYCAVLERRREDLIGQVIFDVFPAQGEGGRLVQESFARVFATGQPDSLALIPYPIERPAARGGGYELRYWSAAHVPLAGPEGPAQFLVQNTVDVTQLQRLKQMAYGPADGTPETGSSEVQLLQRAQEVQALNAALTQETRGLRDLFEQAPGFMAVLVGPELRFTLVNHAYQQLIGHRHVIGRPLEAALPELEGQGFADLLRGVMARREPFLGEAVSVFLRRTPDAELEERFLDFIYQPILSPEGLAWGVFVEGSDVTDRVIAERQQKLLVDELNHRVKNTLATVQSIASQTLRTAESPAAFRSAFEDRLLALSATHDLLTASGWRSASLQDILLWEFGPYGRERYAIDGPDVALTATEAVALGLVIHELATNAAKYGALSLAGGQVQVRWRRVGDVLELTWREMGGPPVTAPTRRGFGSRLIERSLQGQLKGAAALSFSAEGLVCAITLPLSAA